MLIKVSSNKYRSKFASDMRVIEVADVIYDSLKGELVFRNYNDDVVFCIKIDKEIADIYIQELFEKGKLDLVC